MLMHVIAVAFDRAFAATLANEMGLLVALPGLPERHLADPRLGGLARLLALRDGADRLASALACVACRGGLKVDQVKRLKDLETENQRLRKAVADLTLDKLILAEAARGNY